MAFTNMKLTTFGSNIEAKCHQGKGLHFTRIAVGDGLLGNGSMINRTALVSERHSMQIDGIIATENTTQSAVIATLDNSVFTEGFYYREIALFAKDPDTNQEGAYLYDNAGQECEFLGLREDGVVIYERIKMLIRVEQTSQISFDGSGNPLYMSPEDVRGMIEQHNVSEDAHKTKADLGNDGLLKDSQRPNADGLYMPDGKTKISDKIVNIESAMLLALAAAAPYSAAATYAQGAYCTKDGKLYRCTVAIPQAEAWNAAHWVETTMGAELVAIYTTLANKAAATHAAQHAADGRDPITPTDIGAVGYDAKQSLSNKEKGQARGNIDAAESNHDHYGRGIQPTSIELDPGKSAGHGGYIDFHFNGDQSDYTSRIYEPVKGILKYNGHGILSTANIVALLNVNITFEKGVAIYKNSAIKGSSVTFVQWRAGAVSTLTDSVLSTTPQNGSMIIVAKSGFTGGPLPVNILIINR